jgi:NADPH:quinone reductase-like Zn-dependent oxidoreductase
MKAVVLSAYGDIDKLEWREMPDPHPDHDGVVVRVAGAGINPVDWKMRSGAAKARFPVTFPGILGRDASGTVIEVGAGVKAFAVGDRVLGLVTAAYAERVAAPVACWAKVPEAMDLTDAAALPLVVLTGAQLTEKAVNPSAGTTVLVTGATGSVGRVAAYAAKLRGARVWAGVRGAQREQAKTLGLDGVVALDDDADVAKLPLLDAIADTVGGDVIQKLYVQLKPGGTIGSVLGEPPEAKDHGFVVHAFTAQPDPEMLARYAVAVAEGKLVIPIAARFPLERAGEAQKHAETKHPKGKVLLKAGRG